ncbi:ADAMTS-like protein 3 [Varanus komodoensis]|nr:ADAMTS-like protein 3 [Varanus komodoensis]
MTAENLPQHLKSGSYRSLHRYPQPGARQRFPEPNNGSSSNRRRKRVLMASGIGTNVSVVSGDLLRIGCPSHPSAKNVIHWFFKNQPIEELEGLCHRILVRGRILEVHRISSQFAGPYKCCTSSSAKPLSVWVNVKEEAIRIQPNQSFCVDAGRLWDVLAAGDAPCAVALNDGRIRPHNVPAWPMPVLCRAQLLRTPLIYGHALALWLSIEGSIQWTGFGQRPDSAYGRAQYSEAEELFEMQPLVFRFAYWLLSPATHFLANYGWELGEWSPCSATCGKSGTKFRRLLCVSLKGQRVNKSLCKGIPKPLRQRLCKQLKANGTTVTVPLGTCAHKERPLERKPCVGHSCTEWTVHPWGQCTGPCRGSGMGLQHRFVRCQHQNGSVVSNSLCDKQKRPSIRRNCSSDKCDVYWQTGPWRPCTMDCGSGFQSRPVSCMHRRSKRPVADQSCAWRKKPVAWQHCNVTSCDKGECKDTTHYCTFVKQLKLCLIDLYKQRCCQSCGEGHSSMESS